jgi:hypothetical protein
LTASHSLHTRSTQQRSGHRRAISRATSRLPLFVFIFVCFSPALPEHQSARLGAQRETRRQSTPVHHAVSSNFKKRHRHRRHWHRPRFFLAGFSEYQSAQLGAQRGGLRRQLPPLKIIISRTTTTTTPNPTLASRHHDVTTSCHDVSWQSHTTTHHSITIPRLYDGRGCAHRTAQISMNRQTRICVLRSEPSRPRL